MDNEIFAVCAPGYRAATSLSRPADLLDEVLLHLAEYDRNWVTWDAWLKSFGVAGPARRRGLTFDNYLVLIQAALDGQGVALGGGRLAEDFIARGTLIRPMAATLGSDRGFYLLWPSRQRAEPARPALPRLDHRRGQGGEAGGVMHPRPVYANLAAMFARPESSFLAPSKSPRLIHGTLAASSAFRCDGGVLLRRRGHLYPADLSDQPLGAGRFRDRRPAAGREAPGDHLLLAWPAADDALWGARRPALPYPDFRPSRRAADRPHRAPLRHPDHPRLLLPRSGEGALSHGARSPGTTTCPA